MWTGIKRENNEFKEWDKKILKEKANIIIARAGKKIIAGKTNLKILFPLENLKDKEVKNSNNTSIVGKVIYKNVSFLLTGDISQSEEKKLIEQNENLISDVLKVSHHGSKTASSDDFLEKVLPKLAIISVGKGNPYGHPYEETLKNLQKHDIKILRTDIDGDIKIISDGEFLKLYNLKK